MGVAFRVENMRTIQGKSALGFFNVVFGYEDDGEFTPQFVVKDFVVKAKNDGGYWFQAPAKQRFNKDGSPAKKDGYNIYDPYFDLFVAKDGEKTAPTKAAWAFKNALTEAMTEAYTAAAGSNAGRVAAKSSKRAPATATTSKIQEDVPGAPTGDDEDDSLPF